MYETYWQLTQKPFDHSVDPRFYFPGESHQSAVLKLRYAIESRGGGAVLAGPAGSGKTLIVNMLRSTLQEQFTPVVHLVFPQMPCDELLAYLADELTGATGGTGPSGIHQSVQRIERFLADNAREGRHGVIFVDEAHLLRQAETLETLRLMMNFEREGEPTLTLLLVGQTGLLPMLERFSQLEQRLAVKSLIRPFTPQETADYVKHRLKVAGAARQIFEPDALATLHTLTQGIARQINRLCDLALLIGFAEERNTIGADNLESVFQELVAVVPE